jgi:iron complex outermembrane receptor protein
MVMRTFVPATVSATVSAAVSAAFLAALAAAAPGGAQAAAPAAEEEGTAIETIVVTAQKRSQSTQDVGISITQVGGEELQAMHVQQALDLAKFAPSLTAVNATTDATPVFLVRGVGLDDFNSNNSSAVGTYIDEVFASFPGFLGGQMFDLDRVEILKGPQGTLYGRNTEGGAIGIYSRRPGATAEGYADLSLGRWNTLEFNGAVGGPLAEHVNARVAATVTRQGEGYQRDIDSGRTFGRLDRGAMRALLDLRLAPGASLLLNAHLAYDRSVPGSPSTPNVESLVPPGVPVAGLLDTPPGGTLVRVGNLNLFKDEHSSGAAATLEVKFEGFRLTSITAFDGMQSRSLDNYDGYPAADDDWRKNFGQQQWSEELRFTSEGAQTVDWVVGANFAGNRFNGRDSIDQTFVYGLATAVSDTGLAVTQENFNQKQKSLGLFAHTETRFAEGWNLVAGARYSRDRVSFDGVNRDVTGLISYTLAGSTGSVTPGQVLAQLDDAHTEGDLSYKLGLEFHPSGKTMAYASVATSYKAGIYYGQPAQVQADWGYARPEHVRSLELGFKGRFLEDSVQFDAAIFQGSYRDRQSSLSVWGGTPGTLPIIAAIGNIPQSVIRGAEAEAIWRPVGGLELRAAGTWLDGKVRQPISDIRGLAIYATIAPDSPLPLTPKWSWNGSARYDHRLVDGLRGFGQVREAYSGASHPVLGDPTILGPNRTIDARMGVRSEKGWEASLWSNNLMDNRAVSYVFSGSLGQPVTYYQKPRSYGVDFLYEF